MNAHSPVPARVRLLCLALIFSGATALRAVGAQEAVTLAGSVRDSLGLGISGALVQVRGSERTAESDAAGRFVLRAVPTGRHELLVRRIGYSPKVHELSVPSGGASDVIIRLETLAQPMAPVIVRGRETLRGNAAAFYARRASGRGRFLTGEEIDDRQLWTMTDVMRSIPGARMVRVRGRQMFLLRGANTPPVVYLDGIRMSAGEIDLNLLDPRSFLGVEIYSGVATTPPEFSMSELSGRNGGVIVVWTREGRALPRRARRGARSPAEVVAELIEAKEVRTADAVDRPAHIDPANALAPLYPDSLFEARIAGSATLEFVIEADGQLRVETLSIVSATHPAFGTAARDAVLSVRFVAATQRNRNVAQVVMLTVRFEPVASRIESEVDGPESDNAAAAAGVGELRGNAHSTRIKL